MAQSPPEPAGASSSTAPLDAGGPASPSLWRDRSGAAVIEYALICALIVLALVAGIGSLGEENQKAFSEVEESFPDADEYKPNKKEKGEKAKNKKSGK